MSLRPSGRNGGGRGSKFEGGAVPRGAVDKVPAAFHSRFGSETWSVRAAALNVTMPRLSRWRPRYACHGDRARAGVFFHVECHFARDVRLEHFSFVYP